MINESIQNYLKTIYDLAESDGAASTSQIAARLGIAPASVTGMLQKLAAARPPLVVYRKHQGVTLTSDGEKAALEVIRHHRLIETYLVTMLGYSWDNVHEEACRLEHVISEEFEARIAAALGHPTRDPHGEPIPSPELKMPPSKEVPLSTLRPTQRAIIQRVRSSDAEFLRHVDAIGLIPGTTIEALKYSFYDQNLHIKIGKRKVIVVGLAITNQVFINII